MKIGSDDGFKNLEVFVYNSQQLDVVGVGIVDGNLVLNMNYKT